MSIKHARKKHLCPTVTQNTCRAIRVTVTMQMSVTNSARYVPIIKSIKKLDKVKRVPTLVHLYNHKAKHVGSSSDIRFESWQ